MADIAAPQPPARPAAFAYSAADLAHFAGADELSAGAAVAGEEGRRLRARLLADELAAGHRVMMRLAACADYAASNAAAFGGRDALPFDLLAARFAGSAARLMDQFRRGALSLPKVAGPDGEGEVRWVGVCFENEELAPPEEQQRRLARAKAARAAARRDPDPQSPPAPAEQAALAGAEAALRRLVAEAQAESLTAEDTPPRERLFLDQVAAGHRLMMRLAGRTDFQIDRVGAGDAEPEPARHAVFRLSGTAARLMERVRLGLLAIDRLSAGPGGGPRKVTGYYWIGERDLFDGQTTEDRSQQVPDFANESRPAVPAASGATFCLPSSGFCLLNRGRLNNGNPSGDYMTAPRCGAKTRAGCSCRQPAMANGRCRFHGGKSTGPRTEAGRQRARTARLAHGFRSAEIIDLRKAAAATSRRLRTLLSGGIPAGHGVDRHVLRFVAVPRRESPTRPREPVESRGAGLAASPGKRIG